MSEGKIEENNGTNENESNNNQEIKSLNSSDEQVEKNSNDISTITNEDVENINTDTEPKAENFTEEKETPKTLKEKIIYVAKNALLFTGSLLLDALIVLAIVVFVRVFIVSPFQVKGHSMDNSFDDGDFIIVDELSYRFTEPKRGDIIVFKPPSNSLYIQKGILCTFNKIKAKILKQDLDKACLVPEFYVKRVIGTPGDTVEIRSGKVYVTPNSESKQIELVEPYLNETNKDKTCVSGSFSCTTSQDTEGKEYIVPEESYFVLGDNRNGSNDSRHWRKNGQEDSYVPFENIRGKVQIILWPVSHLRLTSNINPIPEE